MTNQDKIRFLKQYKYNDLKINNLLQEKELWRTRAEKVTTIITGMPHSDSQENARENAIVKMIECGQKIDKIIDDYFDLGVKIRRVIETIEEDDLQALLILRYLNNQTFEQIAVGMDYSWRQIHRMHSKALSRLKLS